MSRLSEFSKPILDKLYAFFGFADLDPDEKVKRVLIFSGGCLVAPVLLLFGLSHLFRGDSFLGWFLVIGGVLFVISVLSYHDSQNIDTPVRLCLAFAGCLFIYLLAVSGPHGQMAMWLYVYPPMVFFIFGIREGLLFSALFLFASLFFLLFQGRLQNLNPLDPGFSLRFFISLFLVVFIAFFYELIRNRYLKEAAKNRSRVEEERQNLAAAKRAAEEASRAKSDFLANMSHELRTPLNHILGFTELVVDKQAGDLNREQQEYLEDVLGSGRHLLSLINDILDLSKVEAGKLELEVSEVNLRDLLENSLTMVEEKALKPGIRFSQEIDGVSHRVRADERKLKRILYNLLSNSVKFTPEGGTVVLAARSLSYRQDGWVAGNGQGVEIPFQPTEESRWVEVSVRDTGIGLKKEDLERIFSPFEQADNTASRRYQGTGLGLSLTRRLVELHGGKCWAESEGDGKGSKFNFVIPFDPSWRKEAEKGKGLNAPAIYPIGDPKGLIGDGFGSHSHLVQSRQGLKPEKSPEVSLVARHPDRRSLPSFLLEKKRGLPDAAKRSCSEEWMSRLSKNSESILDKLTAFFGFPGLDLDERLKRILAISTACPIAPVLLFFGLLHLFRGDSFLGWFLVIGGVLFTISVLSIPKFRKVDTVVQADLAFAGCLFIYLLAVSGPHGHMAMWLYIYPLAVFLMLGVQVGLYFNVLFFFASLFVLLFQGRLLNLIPLDPGFSLRFFISLFLVAFVSFFYELVRNHYQKEIEKDQSRLEEEKQNLAVAKRAAEEANRVKSDFLANMSHELRTPLNHILGFTELVVDKQAGDLNREQQEYLEDVLVSGQHLLSLINDILDLSKVEAGKMELHLSEIGLREIMQNSLVMFKEKALKHGLQLSSDVDGIPEKVQADERKLKQILYNLLSNAVKFTPDGGAVMLSARPVSYLDDGWVTPEGRRVDIPFNPTMTGDWINIWVRDTGIGLKKEDKERIFAPFEQAENSASRKYQGSGLGLSLARRFVELHGGQLWAESEGEGKGSKFNFVIPS